MKDPAFLFYPGDWLSGTIGMTLEEKGAYLELLVAQFSRGHMTSDMCGQLIGQNWDKVKFKFKQDLEGLWYNERLDIEKNRRKKYVDSRINNKSGSNQYKKDTDKTGHMTNHTTSHMENRNINRDLNNINSVENEKIQILGQHSDKYVTIQPKTLGSIKYRLNGEDGLNEYYHLNMSHIQRPEFTKKFLIDRNGKVYDDFQHLFNDFQLFIDKQFKR